MDNNANTNLNTIKNKCAEWAANDPQLLDYHDNRWCVPCHDDNELFAMLCLELMQAGLSWSTIIHKEKAIREAFEQFNPNSVALFDEHKIEELMNNKDIVRNRLKIKAVITNAGALLQLTAEDEYKTFDEYIWHFTEGRRIVHHFNDYAEIPAKDALSEKISRDLKKRGFTFVGPVIIYSYLQGIGIYDDHLDDCPCKIINA